MPSGVAGVPAAAPPPVVTPSAVVVSCGAGKISMLVKLS